jgi:hypothetical protein
LGETTVVSNATEEYDGSTWTASGNINTARRGLGGAGTQTAALGFGGSSYTVATQNNMMELLGQQ